MTQVQPRDGVFISLRIRNFRIFILSQTIASSGVWTQRIAQDWLVLTLTGSPTAVGITTAMQFAPSTLLSMAGGVVADRFDKRNVLVITQTALGLCSATLATLCLLGTVQFWHVLALTLATGLAAAFDNPTRQALLHEMVGPKHLSNAVGLNSAVLQIGALIGPAVGVLLIATAGTGFAFAVNATCYAAFVLALLAIDRSRLQRIAPSEPVTARVRPVLAEIRHRPELRWSLALAGTGAFVTANFSVMLVAFAKEMDIGSGGYGLLTCALAAGSLTGALIAARLRHSEIRHVIGLALLAAASMALVTLMPGFPAVCAAIVITGLACTPFSIAATTCIQLAADNRNRGRIMGAYTVVVLGSAGAGGPAFGLLVEAIGAHSALAVGATLITVVTSCAALSVLGAERLQSARRRAGSFITTALLDPDRTATGDVRDA